jgi:hypothetical protein
MIFIEHKRYLYIDIKSFLSTIDARKNGVILMNRLAAFCVVMWAFTVFFEAKEAEFVPKTNT